MVYKHAYLNTLLLLHSTFMPSVVKMPLKGEVGGQALNSHGNYIVDHGKIMELFLNFCGNPEIACIHEMGHQCSIYTAALLFKDPHARYTK